MSTFTLRNREGTETFHRITHKRKWVGRVLQHADGDWLGIIGKTSVRRPTREQAFDDVVAVHLGYSSGAELRARNRRAAQARRLADRIGDYAIAEAYKRPSNFEPLGKLLETPAGATVAIKAFTRELKRKY